MYRFALLCACCLLMLTCLVSHAEPLYTVTALSGNYSNGEGINNVGQVIVWDGTYGNFLWTNGVRQQLPILPYDINDAGQIVGGKSMWHNGVTTSVGSLGDPLRVEAMAISNPGQVVGRACVPETGMNHAFISYAGVMTDLNIGTAYSEAVDVNDSGLIVGWMGTSEYVGTGFVRNNGTVTSLGANRPKAVNNAGQVLCNQKIWQNGVWTSLSLMSNAADINAYGHVVGTQIYSDPWGNQYDWQGKLWKDGIYYDLNSLIPSGSGWNLSYPYAINDHGWIVGEGYYNGVPTAFLLAPVPEPSSLLALGAGLLGLVSAARRRRA